MKNPAVVIPEALQALQALQAATAKTGVPSRTLDLVHLRASQINGCSTCVDAHSRTLKRAGETDERLFALAAWRDAPYFTDAERAALALTEVVTRLRRTSVSRRCRSSLTASRPSAMHGLPNFRETLEVLDRNRVECILVGGVAAVLQGAPISTLDTDIAYRRTADNIERLIAALRELEAIYRDPAGRRIEPDATRAARSPQIQERGSAPAAPGRLGAGPLSSYGVAVLVRRRAEMAGAELR
jgi:AhpD family alkylhydroperoxidase